MKNVLIFGAICCSTLSSCLLGGQDTAIAAEDNSTCTYENPTSNLGLGMLVWDGNCDYAVRIYSDISYTEDIMFNLCDYTHNTCSYFYKPDYGIAHFVVTKEHTDSYEIIYNGEKKGYIKKGANFQFKPWSQYLTELPFGATRRGDTRSFGITEVTGDSVRTDTDQWLRWRQDEQLLIEFYFLM